ncbi:hypothetical protein KCP76_13095 [Salmonella enterica subsp. enterica serovar Weltevreden]|nr:hypothetical protein KCP76_13095 [Salmonella enterica subsp. enterica serovar Weltevreden]
MVCSIIYYGFTTDEYATTINVTDKGKRMCRAGRRREDLFAPLKLMPGGAQRSRLVWKRIRRKYRHPALFINRTADV